MGNSVAECRARSGSVADQRMSTTKMRRVDDCGPAQRVYIKSISKLSMFDIGGCGPPQPPQSRASSRKTPRCYLGGTDWNATCDDPRHMLPGAVKFGSGVPGSRTPRPGLEVLCPSFGVGRTKAGPDPGPVGPGGQGARQVGTATCQSCERQIPYLAAVLPLRTLRN
jgi:hypothetical protein